MVMRATLLASVALVPTIALAGCFSQSSGSPGGGANFEQDSGTTGFDSSMPDSTQAADSVSPDDQTMPTEAGIDATQDTTTQDSTQDTTPEAAPEAAVDSSIEAAVEAGIDAAPEAAVEASVDAPAEAAAVCGDGIIEAGEQCDATNLGGATCQSLHGAGAGGTLACSGTCTFVASSCQWCGDGFIDNGELCDGTAVGTATCATALGSGLGTGTLTCAASCQAYDVSACTCSSGYSVCTSGSPKCVDLTGDPLNCGSCNNACPAQSACTVSHCTTVVTTNLTSPVGLTLDANNIYYTNDGDGKVYSVPLAGGTPTNLLTSGWSSAAWDITLIGSTLVWTAYNGNEVLSVPVTGGAATVLSSGDQVPFGIVNDGTYVYWADSYTFGPMIRRASVATGLVTTLDVPSDAGTVVIAPQVIATDGTYVYWGNASGMIGGSSVYQANVDGSNVIELSPGLDTITGITVDATTVYFTSSISNIVYSVPIGGGATTQLATGEANPGAIANDATSIFWITNNTVRKMAKSGGAPTTISSCNGYLLALSPYCGRFERIALDATYVYVTDLGTQYGHGAVFRAPKN